MKENPNRRQKYNSTSSAYKLNDYKQYNRRDVNPHNNARNNDRRTDFSTTNFDTEYINDIILKQRYDHATKIKNQRLKRKNLMIEKKRRKVDRINYILCYIMLGYAVIVGVFCLMQNDNTNLIKQDINSKKAIIKEQTKTINDLKIQLADSVDIYQIEKIAKEELGMNLPSPDQIVYITLPRQSNYIEYSEPLYSQSN